MIIDIKVPGVGESITEVEVGVWLKEVGAAVKTDEPIVEIESEKAAVEVSAPSDGVLVEILKPTGTPAVIDEVIGRIDTEKTGTVTQTSTEKVSTSSNPSEPTASPEGVGSHASKSVASPKADQAARVVSTSLVKDEKVMPAARRAMFEKGIAASEVSGTGPGGRVLKEDVLRVDNVRRVDDDAKPDVDVSPVTESSTETVHKGGNRAESRERMSRLRRTIAKRLLDAQQNMAILTTFNEVDMFEVKQLRKKMGGPFLDKHGVKLGFMSFFVKAAVAALQDFPLVNARIEGDEIVRFHYCDIGVAVGGGKGLVVPVIRNAECLGFADIERQIADFGERARTNRLKMEELEGGTFTISNGGVFGSMMSTPIVNPPQSGILGLHAIKDRPVVVDGQIVIRPIMYLALSYDHRIVDGKEAVSCLKGIKDRIENPLSLLLEI